MRTNTLIAILALVLLTGFNFIFHNFYALVLTNLLWIIAYIKSIYLFESKVKEARKQ